MSDQQERCALEVLFGLLVKAEPVARREGMAGLRILDAALAESLERLLLADGIADSPLDQNVFEELDAEPLR